MPSVWTALVSCLAVALAAPAQDSTTARDAKGTVIQPKSEPPSQPTAEDVLRTLKLRRPANDVIPPGSRVARDTVAANSIASNRLLLPEGLSVVSRTGRLSQQGLWWVFAFDDDASLPPMKLLPNANLERMVGTLHGAAGPVRFTITGELTVFEGENFLLPRTALRAAGGADTPGHNGNAPPSPPSVPPEVTAEGVLATMRALQPKEAILPIGATAPNKEGGSRSASDVESLLPDGSPLMNRVGRLVRQGSWWTFVSDSDRPKQPEPVLRLLPNQGVERIVRKSQHGGGMFTASGEVTSFDGENYLLTRVATRRVNTGNLRK